MNCSRPVRILFPLVIALLFAMPATAQILKTITLDGVPMVACDEVWIEQEVGLRFTATTPEDCTEGSCFFGIEADNVWLFPARLLIEFGQSYMVYNVEIDVIDWCGVGCTMAFAYNAGGQVASTANTIVSSPETMILTLAGGAADSIAISSCEGQVFEIRITSEIVDAKSTTWSAIKSVFR